MSLTFTAIGTPVGEPRHRSRVVTPKGREPFVMHYPDSKADGWKAQVRAAAMEATREYSEWEPIAFPCCVELTFQLPRPLAHHVASKRDRPLRENAPTYHTKKPDADNLAKAVLDAMTAWPKGEPSLVFTDDCVVAELSVSKVYTIGEPCCVIHIEGMHERAEPF